MAESDPGRLQLPDGLAEAPLRSFLQERLPGLRGTAPLQPDEERFRLIDTMAELLTARADRMPLLL